MGKLYVVPTPVGNMEDMTFRAIRVLKEADLILAEDTRTSSVLLRHYDIKNHLLSHHKFNEHQTVEQLVERILAGETVALISDAGTPAISDPGFLMVRECIRNGIEVTCLPGATAFVPALVSSGLPDERFCFEGFLPQKKGRNTRLLSLVNEPRTIIFYESPYRLVKTLEQFIGYFGPERPVAVCREISKIHEECVRGSLKEVLSHFQHNEPKGEIVIVLGGKVEMPDSGSLDAGNEINEDNQVQVSSPENRNLKKLSNAERCALRRIKLINKLNRMKKLFFLSVCAVAMLTACTGNKAINEAAQRDRDSLMQVISQRDAELDEIMGTVNEINEGFRQINEAQGRVTSEAANGEGANMKAQIQENIHFIQQTLQQNREQLEKLRSRLKNSTLEGTKLKETIDQLTAQLEEKSVQIETLQSELASKNITIEEQTQKIEQLNTNVTELTTQNEEKAKVVAEQDKQINTAWFVFGTKSELKEQNILNKKEVLKEGSFNKNYFTEIDIRTQKEIKLYSKSAKLLTSHPSGSYTLAKDAKGQYVLKINNPNTFWSVSRYLVIQVK